MIVLHDGDNRKPDSADGDDDFIAGKYTNAMYIWLLDDIGNGYTRLIARGRYDYRGLRNVLTSNRFLLEPIAFTTSRKMLLGIKKRAEVVVNQGNE